MTNSTCDLIDRDVGLQRANRRALAAWERALCVAILLAALRLSSPVCAQQVLLKGEMNAVGVYSTRSGDAASAPVTPRTSFGLEWGQKMNSDPERRFALDSMDVHLLLVYDPIERKTLPIPFDAWAKLSVGRHNFLRVGHFQLPFGLNPVLQPRSTFLMPLGAYDLGFKWDWGAEYKGSLGQYDYETAATTGIGERLQGPDGSYLVAGRIGTPTYKDNQFGVSILAGAVPDMMMNHRLGSDKVKRWRVGLDATAMKRPYRVVMAEIAYGQNGGAPVGGVMLAVDHILPAVPRYSVEGQVVTWFHDLSSRRSDNSLVTLALAHTVGNNIIVRVAWVHNLHIAMGERFMGQTGENRLFVQFYRTFDLQH